MAMPVMDAIRALTNKLTLLEPDQKVVFRAGTLLTGRLDGQRVLRDQAVVVEDGLITQVVDWQGYQVPADATLIDASASTVMPGLIEGHVHLSGESGGHGSHLEPTPEAKVLRAMLDAWATMNAGFTTLISKGHGNPKHVAALKTMVNNEGLPGPRIYECGWALSQTAGHGHAREWNYELVKILRPRSTFADGPYALRALVRENLGCGADFAKLYPGEGGPDAPEHVHRRTDFTDEEIQAITDEAHRQGFRVAAHCMTLEHARHAALNGVDMVEHGPVGYEPEFVPMLKATGAAYCPTLMQCHSRIVEAEKRRLTPSMLAKMEAGLAGRGRMACEAIEAGVVVGFGTDTLVRPKAGKNGVEFKLMVDQGMAPLDAISVGTLLCARMVGLDEQLGSVEVGKLADLIVVDGDPSKEIAVLTDPNRITRIFKSPRRVLMSAFHGRAQS